MSFPWVQHLNSSTQRHAILVPCCLFMVVCDGDLFRTGALASTHPELWPRNAVAREYSVTTVGSDRVRITKQDPASRNGETLPPPVRRWWVVGALGMLVLAGSYQRKRENLRYGHHLARTPFGYGIGLCALFTIVALLNIGSDGKTLALGVGLTSLMIIPTWYSVRYTLDSSIDHSTKTMSMRRVDLISLVVLPIAVLVTMRLGDTSFMETHRWLSLAIGLQGVSWYAIARYRIAHLEAELGGPITAAKERRLM